MRIEGQFASFQAQRVCVSWFGTIKLLGVVAVLNCHELPTRTMCDPDRVICCEVVLMCVTSMTCSTAVCVSQLFHNALIHTFGIEGEIASSPGQTVCVSWFGTIKLLGVAVVLIRYGHVLFATHPQPDESCEVVLMCVTSQTRVCNDLFCRCLRDAILSRPINACSILLGFKASSRTFKCSSQSVRVPFRVW